jgi:hypothetical protein
VLVLIRAQSCCLEEHQKSVMTRGRHGDHVSVMVLGNPQNCFFNRSIGNFDGLVCTPILSDASVFLEDRTQITSEQVAQQLLADPMAKFFSGLLGQRLVGGGCAAPRLNRVGNPLASYLEVPGPLTAHVASMLRSRIHSGARQAPPES